MSLMSGQLVDHVLHGQQQLSGFVVGSDIDGDVEVAFGQVVGYLQCLVDGEMMLRMRTMPNQAAATMPAATTASMVSSMTSYQACACSYSDLATSSCRLTSSVILPPMGSMEL